MNYCIFYQETLWYNQISEEFVQVNIESLKKKESQIQCFIHCKYQNKESKWKERNRKEREKKRNRKERRKNNRTRRKRNWKGRKKGKVEERKRNSNERRNIVNCKLCTKPFFFCTHQVFIVLSSFHTLTPYKHLQQSIPKVPAKALTLN